MEQFTSRDWRSSKAYDKGKRDVETYAKALAASHDKMRDAMERANKSTGEGFTWSRNWPALSVSASASPAGSKWPKRAMDDLIQRQERFAEASLTLAQSQARFRVAAGFDTAQEQAIFEAGLEETIPPPA